ncbi:MAG: hypothetical protein QME25_09415 [Bacteroidota bacterium]|nr:hypothetical protein [Bacteroidota bacterium]
MKKKIFNIFSKIVRGLNKMGVEPVIYGSLGLYLLIGKNIKVNDIDFLIKDSDFDRKWDDIKRLLEKNHCKLNPEHRQEFKCNGLYVSFLKIKDVSKLTKINFSRLKKYQYVGGVYRNLSLKQYLDFYRRRSDRKYVAAAKRKRDREKIKLIKTIY